MTAAGPYPQAEKQDGSPVYDEGSYPFFLSYGDMHQRGILPAQRVRSGNDVPRRETGGMSYRTRGR